MELGIEELISRILTFLEKELGDPVFVAEVTAFLTALNNWLEAQIKAQGGTPIAPPASPNVVSESQAAQPEPAADKVLRARQAAIKPPVYH